MRKTCAICGCSEYSGTMPLDFVVPDGWELPEHNTVLCCKDCGFIWYDNDKTQEDYDAYYQKRYGYGLTGPDTEQRFKDAYNFIRDCGYSELTSILDYGGGEGDLVAYLRKQGFDKADNYSLGDPFPGKMYDLVIVSHVLEHIYDIHPFLDKVTALTSDALIFDQPMYDNPLDNVSPIIDLHQKHINHFRVEHVDTLMFERSFDGFDMQSYYLRGTTNYRKLYKRFVQPNFEELKVEFAYRTQAVIDRANAIKKPVIIWGLGDLAWYIIKHSDMDIAYFVDNDPAYRGATLLGKPVLEKPISGEPIVIIAFAQHEALVDRIHSECDNEIIEI